MEKKKFGLIGHPVGHSLSAVMHRRVFDELGLSYTYDAFDVLPENLGDFMKDVGLDGMNVTIPHKVEVMDFLDELDESAWEMGAVNTVKLGERRIGYNTDGFGFLESLREEGFDLAGKSVLVVGAGGVSRAILVSLVNGGANVVLMNRTRKRADDLVEKMSFGEKVRVVDYDEDILRDVIEDVDLIVNTTSLGMHPKEGVSPVPKEFLKKEHVVYDVVYNPLKTQLIRDAEEIGAKTISGMNMLVHQGAQSLRIWLEIEPPVDAMKEAVRKRLEKKL